MNNRKLALLLGVMMCLSFDIFSQSTWEINKSKDGIVVFTKEEKDSDFKSFKAVAFVEASTTDIVQLLQNADDYTKWYGYTKTAKILKKGKDAQYNYVETIFPWPYRNRDMVYEMSMNTLNSDVIEISLKGLADYVPEKKGIVRIKKAEGYILLKPSANKTEVTYVFHSEPGENVPAWLANNSIAELPYKTLLGLRKILEEENKAIQ